MKKIILLLLLSTSFFSCSKQEVGYLITTDAIYDPKTMTIKKVLDPIDDENRITNKIPWVSIRIQGVEGTLPIKYTISNVTATGGGDAVAFKKKCKLRGDSAFEIPFDHNLALGEYTVDITISNEGYSHAKTGVFKVIVE
jgi:hypothetical protein